MGVQRPSLSACVLALFRSQMAPELFFSQPDLLLQLVTMASPQALIHRGVPVVTLLQVQRPLPPAPVVSNEVHCTLIHVYSASPRCLQLHP